MFQAGDINSSSKMSASKMREVLVRTLIVFCYLVRLKLGSWLVSYLKERRRKGCQQIRINQVEEGNQGKIMHLGM